MIAAPFIFCLTVVGAAVAKDAQIPLDGPASSNLRNGVSSEVNDRNNIEAEVLSAPYEVSSHPAFTHHQLRITEPTLCDPSVKQYSGFFDISENKHLFFWFFESRTSPEEAPLTMWLNGGPGCSSSTGLLFELGPCSIENEGNDTSWNPHSWNTHSNMIFLDQPVNVGFSYGDGPGSVNTSIVGGQDVYAFMQLFLAKFPKYADLPFHLAGESYAGTYIPHIATTIYHKNKELAITPHADLMPVKLTSLLLGNGMTENYMQFASVPEYLCESPFAIFKPNGPECTDLRSRVPTCQRLINTCRTFQTKLTCGPAVVYCFLKIYGPVLNSGRNPYDIRLPCDDFEKCYEQKGWINQWFNRPEIKAELGVASNGTFASCNANLALEFFHEGEAGLSTHLLLPEMINNGVRLLVYAGDNDMLCNYIGEERWLEALDHHFHKEFNAAKSMPWITTESRKKAGTVRSAGGGGKTAGNVTFVTVYDAGHMMPHDQPEAALDLFTRWIRNDPLA